MELAGTIRSTETWTHEGEGDEPTTAREAAIEGMPEGYDLLRVITVFAKIGQPFKLCATARSTETRELTASGADYVSAREALLAQIPEGWQLLGVVVLDE